MGRVNVTYRARKLRTHGGAGQPELQESGDVSTTTAASTQEHRATVRNWSPPRDKPDAPSMRQALQCERADQRTPTFQDRLRSQLAPNVALSRPFAWPQSQGWNDFDFRLFTAGNSAAAVAVTANSGSVTNRNCDGHGRNQPQCSSTLTDSQSVAEPAQRSCRGDDPKRTSR